MSNEKIELKASLLADENSARNFKRIIDDSTSSVTRLVEQLSRAASLFSGISTSNANINGRNLNISGPAPGQSQQALGPIGGVFGGVSTGFSQMKGLLPAITTGIQGITQEIKTFSMQGSQALDPLISKANQLKSIMTSSGGGGGGQGTWFHPGGGGNGWSGGSGGRAYSVYPGQAPPAMPPPPPPGSGGMSFGDMAKGGLGIWGAIRSGLSMGEGLMDVNRQVIANEREYLEAPMRQGRRDSLLGGFMRTAEAARQGNMTVALASMSPSYQKTLAALNDKSSEQSRADLAERLAGFGVATGKFTDAIDSGKQSVALEAAVLSGQIPALGNLKEGVDFTTVGGGAITGGMTSYFNPGTKQLTNAGWQKVMKIKTEKDLDKDRIKRELADSKIRNEQEALQNEMNSPTTIRTGRLYQEMFDSADRNVAMSGLMGSMGAIKRNKDGSIDIRSSALERDARANYSSLDEQYGVSQRLAGSVGINFARNRSKTGGSYFNMVAGGASGIDPLMSAAAGLGLQAGGGESFARNLQRSIDRGGISEEAFNSMAGFIAPMMTNSQNMGMGSGDFMSTPLQMVAQGIQSLGGGANGARIMGLGMGALGSQFSGQRDAYTRQRNEAVGMSVFGSDYANASWAKSLNPMERAAYLSGSKKLTQAEIDSGRSVDKLREFDRMQGVGGGYANFAEGDVRNTALKLWQSSGGNRSEFEKRAKAMGGKWSEGNYALDALATAKELEFGSRDAAYGAITGIGLGTGDGLTSGGGATTGRSATGTDKATRDAKASAQKADDNEKGQIAASGNFSVAAKELTSIDKAFTKLSGDLGKEAPINKNLELLAGKLQKLVDVLSPQSAAPLRAKVKGDGN